MPILTLLTWNIWAKANWQPVADLLRSSCVDLAALQEVDRHYGERSDWRDIVAEVSLLSGLPHNAYSPSIDLPGESGFACRQFGNALVSKLPLSQLQCLGLSPASEWDGESPATEPRTALATVVNVGGTPVRIVTFHLGYTPHFQPDPLKYQQAERLLDFAEGASDTPTVLLGDANALPGSPEVALLCSSRLRNAVNPPRFTWPLHGFSFEGWDEPPGARYTIDYVFVSHHFEVEQVDLLESNCSDHLPLSVKLRLR